MKKIVFILVASVIFIFSSIAFAQESVTTQESINIAETTTQTQSIPQATSEPQKIPMPISDTQQPIPLPPKEGEIKPMPPKFQEKIDIEREEPREFINPQEIKDVIRQIKDLKKEIKRLVKKAKKANLINETGQLEEMTSQITNLETTLKNTPPESLERETLQDFYDAQLWDKMNDIRIKIELPNEIKMLERDIKKLEKMITKKSFSVEGVDMEKIKGKVTAIKDAVSKAKEELSSGNLEDARESLQIIYEEGAHPGEMMGVVSRLADITRQLKRFKSQEIKDDINEILKPVFEAINSDDYREANMLLNEIQRELWKVIEMARFKPQISDDLREKMDKLEEKLKIKMEKEEQKNESLESVKKEGKLYYNNKHKSMSMIGNIIESIKLLLNL